MSSKPFFSPSEQPVIASDSIISNLQRLFESHLLTLLMLNCKTDCKIEVMKSSSFWTKRMLVSRYYSKKLTTIIVAAKVNTVVSRFLVKQTAFRNLVQNSVIFCVVISNARYNALDVPISSHFFGHGIRQRTRRILEICKV